jgi:8-oxo-dGTP pyrophosphatase MutT (NUDIX family)
LEPYGIFVGRLKNFLSNKEKPGALAQELMAPSYKKYVPISQPVVDAAVMVLIYPLNNKPYFVLIKRTDDGRLHGGQVSFPGGKFDPADVDFYQTALRETTEEVGVSAADIHYAGSLSSLVIPVSGFRVHPFVGYLHESPLWKINPAEVKYVVEVAVDELFNPLNVHREEVVYNNTLHTIPYFKLSGEKVWGATAMILAELKALLSQES